MSSDRKRGRRGPADRPRKRPSRDRYEEYDEPYDDDDEFDDYDDEEEDDWLDDYDDQEEPEDRPPRRKRSRASAGGRDRGRTGRARQARPPRPSRRRSRKAPPQKEGFLARLFGKRTRPPARGRGGGLDFGAVEEEFDDYYEDDVEPAPRKRGRRPAGNRQSKGGRVRKKKTLLELCTPVFGYSAVLPRQEGDGQPEYLQFRQQVVSAIQRIEKEAADYGIEEADAREAAYGLALFMDEQVLGSTWAAREQWSGEPLNIVLNQDPMGGENFFKKLDNMRDGQTALKEIYLLCLAMGFRGRFATEEMRVQAQKIGEIKKRILESIQDTAMDSRDLLFPEAYMRATVIEDEAEQAPPWWIWSSVGAVVVAFLLYILLFWVAGRLPAETVNSLEIINNAGLATTTGQDLPDRWGA